MRTLLASLAAILVVSFAPNAWAVEDATNILTVDATVATECSVGGGMIDFGSYAPITAESDYTSSGTFTVYCTKGTTVHVGLGMGSNNERGRRVRHGEADFLTYGIFQDASHTQVWGDSFADRVTIASTSGIPGDTLTFFGKMQRKQNLPAGNYSDTIAINVWID